MPFPSPEFDAAIGALRTYLDRIRSERATLRDRASLAHALSHLDLAAEQGEDPEVTFRGPTLSVDLHAGAVPEFGDMAAAAHKWHGKSTNPLRIARERCGLHRNQAADLLGVPLRTLTRWESSDHPAPPITALRRMATEYGVSADELIGGNDG